MKYLFTVWLRDLSLPADDPEFEWPACLVIEGASESSAQAWGDHLSQRYARTSVQTVVRSTTKVLETSRAPGLGQLPVVRVGEEVTDRQRGGWR